MRNNSAHYTYKIFWFDPDQKFVGTCVEMPGLSHLDEDAEAAGRGIRELVALAVDDMIRDGETPPEAIMEANYSGHFVTRVPKMLHARLALEARENGVSLNSLVNHKLSLPAAPIAPRMGGVLVGLKGAPIAGDIDITRQSLVGRKVDF